MNEHILVDLLSLSRFKTNLYADLNNSGSTSAGMQTQINDLKDRIIALEIAGGAEVTANPFAVTFGNLTGLNVNAIWNSEEARLEF